jgi:hypothetical protein
MRRAEPLAGLGGIVLLVSLFLSWYGVDLPRAVGDLQPFRPEDVTAWQAFSVIDLLLALVALPALAVPFVSLLSSGPAKAIGLEVITSVTGLIGVLLVVFRLVDAPSDGLDLRAGAWLGLAGALIAWIGSWMSLRDESTPGAVAPDVPRRPAPPSTSP